jgi:transposase
VRRSFAEELGRKVGVGEQLGYTPAYIGVDEFAVRKGRLFHTAVSDLGEKQVVGVESGHSCQSLVNFLNRVPDPEQVVGVVMDMHEPYRQAVELCCPNAAIVADKFHVIRRVNQALDQRRVKVQEQLKEGRRSELFRSRYLLLKSREGLSQGEQAKVERILEQYPVLKVAWELKEAFRAMYRAPSRVEGARCLGQWVQQVQASGLEEFKGLLSMVARWGKEVLNYFDHRLTNGYVEGKNNRIKVIKRVAYGYQNVEVFAQRILLSNEALPRPRALKFNLHTY